MDDIQVENLKTISGHKLHSVKLAAGLGRVKFIRRDMSRNYKIRDQDKLYFVSFAAVNWIDVFVRPIYKDIIVDSLKYCIVEKGLEVYAWCIMTSHVHLIIGQSGEGKLEDIIRDLKRHTSKSTLKSIEENHQESRKEWLLWMFERAGKRNPNNKKYQFRSRIIILLNCTTIT